MKRNKRGRSIVRNWPLIRTRVPESSTSKRTVPPTCGSTVTSTMRTGTRTHPLLQRLSIKPLIEHRIRRSGHDALHADRRRFGHRFALSSGATAPHSASARIDQKSRLLVDPLLGHRQSVRLQGKPVLAATHLALHEPGRLQHADVARDARERHRQRRGQVGNAGVTSDATSPTAVAGSDRRAPRTHGPGPDLQPSC